MRRLDVRREARTFAEGLSGLLNCTLTTGLRIGVADADDVAAVGYGVSANGMGAHVPFELSAGPQGQRLSMIAWYLLEADDEGDYMRVQTSVVELRAERDNDQSLLLHVDYERDKDGYPESHLQINASGPHWEAVSPSRHLSRLHLPVGGRRYRPTIEDVVEFVIAERLATGHEGWQDVVDQRRADFRRTQLKAAVRRDPGTAQEALIELAELAAKASAKSKRRR